MSQTPTIDSTFDDVAAALAQRGDEAATDCLAEHLRAQGDYHALFDARLLQARLRLGLPAILTASLDDLAEPLRSQMEEQYLAACREVGKLLLEAARLREAWMYLRPAGDKEMVAEALRKLSSDESLRESIIEIALHEGVAPKLGFELILASYGTCNAITMFDSQMHGRPQAQRQEVAALLVRHLHGELMRSLRSEINRRQGSEPVETTIAGMVADRDWLFANNDYHIDTSHLAAVVRFALLVDDPEVLRLAIDMTQYGRRLSSMYQFPGQEPFVDSYPTHALFFGALVGESVEEALDYFRSRAADLANGDAGTAAAEIYIGLLARLGRTAEALDETARLLPPDARTGGFAPTLLELAQKSKRFDRLVEISRQRGDVLSYTMALVEDSRQNARAR